LGETPEKWIGIQSGMDGEELEILVRLSPQEQALDMGRLKKTLDPRRNCGGWLQALGAGRLVGRIFEVDIEGTLQGGRAHLLELFSDLLPPHLGGK
jgi:hypothetical protein